MTTRTTRPDRRDTEPLTVNQLGAIHRGFARLGFDREGDRGERLAVTAALAISGPIGTTRELTMGEAGRVIGALSQCETAGQLYAMADSTDAITRPRPIVLRILTALFR